jgi:hypothetical protein
MDDPMMGLTQDPVYWFMSCRIWFLGPQITARAAAPVLGTILRKADLMMQHPALIILDFLLRTKDRISMIKKIFGVLFILVVLVLMFSNFFYEYEPKNGPGKVSKVGRYSVECQLKIRKGFFRCYAEVSLKNLSDVPVKIPTGSFPLQGKGVRENELIDVSLDGKRTVNRLEGNVEHQLFDISKNGDRVLYYGWILDKARARFFEIKPGETFSFEENISRDYRLYSRGAYKIKFRIFNRFDGSNKDAYDASVDGWIVSNEVLLKVLWGKI